MDLASYSLLMIVNSYELMVGIYTIFESFVKL